ncbi:hypothetical protein FOA52_001029 [Chlamydomonas sp. UWO 241]|nr:hypothetical protein FOA52_001029 [Chlamydomonas sp. UWO 241]
MERGGSGSGPGPGTSQPLRRFYVGVSSHESRLGTLMELLTALHQSSGDGSMGGGCLSAAVCCGSRDSLDEVVAALLHCQMFSVYAMHSDMTDRERDHQVRMLKGEAAPPAAAAASAAAAGAAAEPPGPAPTTASPAPSSQQVAAGRGSRPSSASASQQAAPAAGPPAAAAATSAAAAAAAAPGAGRAGGRPAPSVVVATDVVLRALPKELLPLGLPLLVQYDLPRQKEVYVRRVSSVFGGGKERRNASGRSAVVDLVSAPDVPLFRMAEAWYSGGVRQLPVRVSDIFD